MVSDERPQGPESPAEDGEGNCPVCRKGDLITISMTVQDATLAFTACHFCESKWWERDGVPLPLESVIGLVSEP